MFSSSLNIGYTTEMLGLLVVMGVVSIPVSKPTINCFAVDHRLHAISGKVCTKHGISRHRTRRPVRNHRRQVDYKRWGMRFPVPPKHLPTPRNHALRSIFNLARPGGVGANQVCAADETRRHSPAGKTVELRGTSPDKDTIVRGRFLDDVLNNREKIEILHPRRERHSEKAYRRQSGRTNNACSHPSPAWLRKTSLFRDEAREHLARENRQRRKNCQMIMSRKSPSNKDHQITENQPQNKQHLLVGNSPLASKSSECLNHLPNTKIP